MDEFSKKDGGLELFNEVDHIQKKPKLVDSVDLISLG